MKFLDSLKGLTLAEFVKKSLTPLIYANLAGMVFGALSLLWVGYFTAVWPGFLCLLMSSVVFPIALLPAALTTGLMAMAMKTHPKLEKILTFVSIVYLVSVLSAFTMLTFYFLIGAPTFPAAVYAVTSSVLPWLLFAAKDRDNVFFTGLVVYMQAAALILVIANVTYRIYDFTIKYAIIWGSTMFFVFLQWLYEKLFLEKKLKAKAAQQPPTIQIPE